MTDDELCDALRQKLTDDFLSTLVQAGRTYGWWGDYTEITGFVRWCFHTAGKEAPGYDDLEPFETED